MDSGNSLGRATFASLMSIRGVVIHSQGARLEGMLVVPAQATGLVVFAHGSGSSRRSPRNERVARALQARGLGTLLFDLLTEEEARNWEFVFDIDLLTARLLSALHFARTEPTTRDAAIGLFGASSGAAAALGAAAHEPSVSAVVCRGGRPDLAMRALPLVEAPTLLIVGEFDPEVLSLNAAAAGVMHCRKHLAIVPKATHLFAELGCLDEVCRLAGDWFDRHLASGDAHGNAHVP